MVEQGKYLQLWMKYAPVIRVLLKKTDNENQSIQLYKHEFEAGGNREKSGYSFSIELKNGKVTNKISTVAVARDLAYILDNTSGMKSALLERNIKISMNKTFELHVEKL